MVVPECKLNNQEKFTSRKERRPEMIRLKKKKRKLLRKLKKVNLEVEFNNETATSVGNFALVETFKKAVGIDEIVGEELNIKKHWNRIYSSETLLDYMIDGCILGKSRFEHIGDLAFDPGYKKIKDIEIFPGEGRFRDLMGRVKPDNIEELLKINRRIIELKSKWEGVKEVWLDHDDSVITLFGKQEEGEVGYNPQYHGRPSYKAKVCFIAGTEELLHLDLYSGKTHSNGQFLDFHKKCEEMLPHNYVLKGVRGDRGFCSEDNADYFEERSLEYVLKMKMTTRLRRQIEALSEKYWKDLDDVYSVAELEYLPSGWKFPRRVAVVRERAVKETGQMCLPGNAFYKYQAIMTNKEDAPEEIWRFYNKRANVENKIDELKDGFGVDEASQHEMIKNRAFGLIKAISYNIVTWFKRVCLPGVNYEVKTIRRKVLQIAGNVVGNGWYRKIQLGTNRWLERMVGIIKENLDLFILFVANGFEPIRV